MLPTQELSPGAHPALSGTGVDAELWIVSLGVAAYAEALEFQRAVARGRIAGTIAEDVLILTQHPPVVTLGRATKQRNLISSPELLAARGVELHDVERGGDATFHGPGQLVGYPIVDLKRHRRDLHWYLRQMEEALIAAAAEYGVPAERSAGLTGVWTQGRKLASIGVHARDWVTWHGFALNVTTDLSYFDLIVPCGIAGVIMTSLEREAASHEVTLAGVEDAVTRAFGSVFNLSPRHVEESEIRSRMG